ncbi:phosphatidylinositol-glycan biosynthesis class F protein-like [Melia azedarach]|uniref:Phosphatidylinositol-glycan biosynthesis class F protein-like n=1 Tax=Melia azedarach TaxID=155640 RepID=A0ACC1Y4P4_MELAZ|nr:phosphatidylinositol-glycan biosynthesis class F protein-like [Melia azedarach]
MVKDSTAENPGQSVSPTQAILIHLICGVGLAVGFSVAHNVYFINLVSDPSHTLRLIWVIESPFVILLYSFFRQNPEKCSYLKAVIRGVLALPVGALVNALGAIALGAPVGSQYFQRTINWSLLMSLFTFVPPASVFGSSSEDWRRIFANTKPKGSLDYMICLPAHGAVVGAWFGAWPMPLDWERPWQEWPICVTYGAVAGYLVAMVASLVLILIQGGQQHPKSE